MKKVVDKRDTICYTTKADCGGRYFKKRYFQAGSRLEESEAVRKLYGGDAP